MSLTTKEAVCAYLNKELNLLAPQPKQAPEHWWCRLPFIALPKRVHVPIYTKPWKIKLIRALQRKRYSLEEMEQEIWCCRSDYSKLVPADQWKTYPLGSKIAIPRLTDEYTDFWTICPVYAFYQEDLSYGVRPMYIYYRLVEIGGGQLFFINKKDHSIYEIGGSDVVLIDNVGDFKKFLQHEETSISWKKTQLK